MSKLSVFVCLAMGYIVHSQCEIMSLNYIYTALSKPVELPGIHEFTAMGLMNDRPIDYYDSVTKKKVSKQNWMKERLPEDYWEKGTQSRKSKEQWFKVNVNILMERMRQNDTDVHILQWKHGCEIDQQSDGTLKFKKGTDQYSYDGDDFLSFDDDTMQWVAPCDQAVPTKRKWDGVQILNQYTKGYLEKECVDWLEKFLKYGEEELKKMSPPKVYAFARKSTCEGQIRLTCMATGFYPKDVKMRIMKNGTELTKDAKIHSDGVLPNEDGTYQIRMTAQIPEKNTNGYECVVNHRSLEAAIVEKWNGVCCDCGPSGGVITVFVVGIIIIISIILFMVLFFLWKTGRICQSTPIYQNGNVNGNLLNMPNTAVPNGVHQPMLPNGGLNGFSGGAGNGVNQPMLPNGVPNGVHLPMLPNGGP
ncbi:hypothetical protein UPYG_G00338790 [Umbra pygmaea]|uniref:Ig-like domain-containing protein n=1 Tax=Umbra pygmaea TaxID=75934 RepID=A0ABD0WDN8_UMBPY